MMLSFALHAVQDGHSGPFRITSSSRCKKVDFIDHLCNNKAIILLILVVHVHVYHHI